MMDPQKNDGAIGKHLETSMGTRQQVPVKRCWMMLENRIGKQESRMYWEKKCGKGEQITRICNYQLDSIGMSFAEKQNLSLIWGILALTS